MEFNTFKANLNKKFEIGGEYYKDFLETIIDKPQRFTGIFRSTKPKIKLLQNVSQSREIKFGNFFGRIYYYLFERKWMY